MTKVGRHPDGAGLYLSISANGGKRWIFLFRLRGRTREMGLGPINAVSLAAARERAAEARSMVARGIDPIEARDKTPDSMSFSECSDRFIAGNKSGWRNAKHAAQWKSTLDAYAAPVLGRMAVREITVSDIVKVLEPIWRTKTETAGRVRSRVEAVLDWAQVHKFREGENPARWRGHLDKVFPPRSNVRRVRHHPALPYLALPGFVAELRVRPGVAAMALEFTILTAARTNETIGATWSEVDIANAVWTIPGARMKAQRVHRVPLAARCVELLKGLRGEGEMEPTAVVFPGARRDGYLSNAAMLALLDRMDRGSITVHGFRSTFRDWASETTPYPNEVIEMALAHIVANKTEAAYRRGDLFDKRRALMADWAAFAEAGQ